MFLTPGASKALGEKGLYGGFVNSDAPTPRWVDFQRTNLWPEMGVEGC